MLLDIKEIMRQLPNEEKEQWRQEWLEMLDRDFQDEPELVLDALSGSIKNISPEQFAELAKNASPEQFATLLESATREQRESAFLNLSDEELEQLLKKRAQKGKN